MREETNIVFEFYITVSHYSYNFSLKLGFKT